MVDVLWKTGITVQATNTSLCEDFDDFNVLVAKTKNIHMAEGFEKKEGRAKVAPKNSCSNSLIDWFQVNGRRDSFWAIKKASDRIAVAVTAGFREKSGFFRPIKNNRRYSASNIRYLCSKGGEHRTTMVSKKILIDSLRVNLKNRHRNGRDNIFA
jgi:hypothetical protein